MQGVYLITNAITGAKYVGQSVNIERRFMEHKTPNASMKSKSKLFQDDIKKYGIENFKFEVLEECDKDDLLKTEKKWIKEIQPEYNRAGRVGVSEECREKIRQTLRLRWQEKPESEKKFILEHRLIGPRKGHLVLESTRQKLRDANLGRRTYGVLVIETGQVFRGAQECAEALGCCYYSVLNQLSGKTKTTKGYHLERVETIRDECNGVGRR